MVGGSGLRCSRTRGDSRLADTTAKHCSTDSVSPACGGAKENEGTRPHLLPGSSWSRYRTSRSSVARRSRETRAPLSSLEPYRITNRDPPRLHRHRTQTRMAYHGRWRIVEVIKIDQHRTIATHVRPVAQCQPRKPIATLRVLEGAQEGRRETANHLHCTDGGSGRASSGVLRRKRGPSVPTVDEELACPQGEPWRHSVAFGFGWCSWWQSDSSTRELARENSHERSLSNGQF